MHSARRIGGICALAYARRLGDRARGTARRQDLPGKDGFVWRRRRRPLAPFERSCERYHAPGFIERPLGHGAFPSSHPLLYCNTTEQLHSQSTKAASISGSGSFQATINERFKSGPGAAAIVQVVSGRFSGGSVSGTVHTEAGECGGSTSFSAKG